MSLCTADVSKLYVFYQVSTQIMLFSDVSIKRCKYIWDKYSIMTL